MFNVAGMLEDSARTVPDRTALVCGPSRLTYAEVNARACRVAHLLVSHGVQPGDKVALSCPNVPDFAAVYYGILKAGAVVVPLNVLLKSREIAYHLSDSDAVAYFCFEGAPGLPMGEEGRRAFESVPGCRDFVMIAADPTATPHARGETYASLTADQADEFESVATGPDDTAVILYTSGTTGQPKGAELSHANIGFNVLASHRLFGTDPDRPDFHLVALPLFHSFGQTVQLNCGFGSGSTLVLMPRFDASAALRLMQEEQVTFFAGVPTMYWGLLHALDTADGIDVETIASRLRLAIAGGSSLPVEILSQVRQRLHVQILEGYGLSETSPVATFNQRGAEPRPGSVGTPIWGVEACLLDLAGEVVDGPDVVGEVAIRGHNVMKGYYKRPEETAAVMHGDWFRTGDLARRDADGYYYIVDRAKDMILRGGFNVYPREVEEVLMTHPDVSLAAVVGVPDEENGEEVKAFVIRAEGSGMTEGDLVAWAREQMAGYKYPRSVEFVEALPMTATGKIMKRELRRR